MDFSALLASFAAAFSQHQRLPPLQLDGGQIAAEQLLPPGPARACQPIAIS
jgi:hypothetical protein